MNISKDQILKNTEVILDYKYTMMNTLKTLTAYLSFEDNVIKGHYNIYENYQPIISVQTLEEAISIFNQ